jgi:hypothetical protein
MRRDRKSVSTAGQPPDILERPRRTRVLWADMTDIRTRQTLPWKVSLP